MLQAVRDTSSAAPQAPESRDRLSWQISGRDGAEELEATGRKEDSTQRHGEECGRCALCGPKSRSRAELDYFSNLEQFPGNRPGRKSI
jgi:hypothetical protein